jgi:hypothetical protein
VRQGEREPGEKGRNRDREGGKMMAKGKDRGGKWEKRKGISGLIERKGLKCGDREES